MAIVAIEGMEEILRNLNRAIATIKNQSIQGLIKCAILIRNDTESTGNPKTPEKLSNLVHSFFVTTPLGVHDGKSPDFEGPDGGEMAKDHMSVVSNAQAEVSKATVPTMIMGYTANYALWVHERVDANVKWTRPGSGPKWFEISLNKNKGKILEIIGKEAKVALTKNYATTKTRGERTETMEM